MPHEGNGAGGSGGAREDLRVEPNGKESKSGRGVQLGSIGKCFLQIFQANWETYSEDAQAESAME